MVGRVRRVKGEPAARSGLVPLYMARGRIRDVDRRRKYMRELMRKRRGKV